MAATANRHESDGGPDLSIRGETHEALAAHTGQPQQGHDGPRGGGCTLDLPGGSACVATPSARGAMTTLASSRSISMNMIKFVVGATAAAVVSIGAVAQTPTSTDEARVALSQAMAESAWARTFERPTLEDASSGDYQAEWRNEARLANFYRFHRMLHEYEAGVRSTPIPVDSTTSAREEAARVSAERQLASYVAYLQTSAAARLVHQAALSEQGLVATK
jgi:hypothetical protein